jgi:hypothetical protein
MSGQGAPGGNHRVVLLRLREGKLEGLGPAIPSRPSTTVMRASLTYARPSHEVCRPSGVSGLDTAARASNASYAPRRGEVGPVQHCYINRKPI